MCCLFGLLDYTGHFTGKQKNKIVSILSVACEERGTDATGISYNHDEHLTVFKRPIAAHKMKFSIPNVPLIMGHTRMTTQGDEKRNYNNHPFYGKVDNTEFTLAHNGVLHNDDALQKSEKLPETKIETDSYVAVQLIEKKRELSFESLKFMAEKLLGSFTITVMDKEDNLYFIKGDNPMCIYHFPEIGVYIYASTEDILKKALKKIPYRFGNGIKINISCGDILKLNRYGRITKSKFDTELLDTYNYYAYPSYRRYTFTFDAKPTTSRDNDYIQLLKNHAAYYGYTEDMVDILIDEGYSTDDIEEMLYCGVF